MRNLMRFACYAAVTLLCGCGQKGPLVLPDAQQHNSKTSAPAATSAPQPVTEPASAALRAAPATAPTP